MSSCLHPKVMLTEPADEEILAQSDESRVMLMEMTSFLHEKRSSVTSSHRQMLGLVLRASANTCKKHVLRLIRPLFPCYRRSRRSLCCRESSLLCKA